MKDKRHGLYPVAGLLAGVILGMCRPSLRTRKGAMLIGSIAALPFCVGVNLLTRGPITTWGGIGIIATIGTSMLLGGMAGYIWWTQFDNW